MMWILCPLGVGHVERSIIGKFLSFEGLGPAGESRQRGRNHGAPGGSRTHNPQLRRRGESERTLCTYCTVSSSEMTKVISESGFPSSTLKHTPHTPRPPSRPTRNLHGQKARTRTHIGATKVQKVRW